MSELTNTESELTKTNEDGEENSAITVEPADYGGKPKYWTVEKIAKEAESLEKWLKNEDNYYIRNWLAERRIGPATVLEWCDRLPFFEKVYARAKLLQENRLVHLATTRKGDGNFIKFVLSNKHGWKEKSEVAGDNANPLAVILGKINDTKQEPLSLDNQPIEVEPIKSKKR